MKYCFLREEVVCYLQTKDNWVNLCQLEERPLQTSVFDYAPHSRCMRAKPLTAVHSRLPPLSRRLSPFRPGSLPIVLQDCTPRYKGLLCLHSVSPERKTGCSFHLPNYSQGRLGTPRVQKPSHDCLDNENLVFADSCLHPGLCHLVIVYSGL